LTKRKPLSEEQWLSAKEPNALLNYLQQHRVITRVPGGRRRLALFACACCRLVWGLLDKEPSRRAVEVSERAAEGQASRQELGAAAVAAEAVWRAAQQHVLQLAREAPSGPERWPALAANGLAQAARTAAARRFSVQVAESAALTTASAVLWLAEASAAGQQARRALMDRQAELVRCIFGNPFRPASVSPAWRTPQAVALAQAASDQREMPSGTLDLARLAVLADALEDAGCADAGLLGHLRGAGPHVRGCWAVDLLLGKA
jgi:hypothetical protein